MPTRLILLEGLCSALVGVQQLAVAVEHEGVHGVALVHCTHALFCHICRSCVYLKDMQDGCLDRIRSCLNPDWLKQHDTLRLVSFHNVDTMPNLYCDV